MARAIEGFANPAVVTIAAVLVLSGGLYKTGVANVVGAQVLRLAGESPVRVTALLMLTSGIMSGVMNNTAAVALLIPVVIGISRRLGMRPSRLLSPLSFAALLGGMTTLIGTGPNILLSSILERMGQGGFGFFAFTPVGATALTLGVLYVVVAGRHFLPDRSTGDGDDEGGDEIDLTGRYHLAESLLTLRIPPDSALDGCSLVEARLGQALGYDLLAVRRRGHLVLAPERDFRLRSEDVLVVEGRIEALERLRAWGHLARHRESNDALGRLVKDSTVLAEVEIAEKSDLVDSTVGGIDFRNRFQAHVVAIRRGDDVLSGSFQAVRLEAGDALLLLGSEDQLQQLRYATEFSAIGWTDIGSATEEYELYRWLMRLHVPDGSWLDGKTLAASRLRRAFDLTVLEIEREDGDIALPDASERMRAGDRLIVEGDPSCFAVLEALQALVPADERPSVDELESEDVGFAEVHARSEFGAGRQDAPRRPLPGVLRTEPDLDLPGRAGLSLEHPHFAHGARVRGRPPRLRQPEEDRAPRPRPAIPRPPRATPRGVPRPQGVDRQRDHGGVHRRGLPQPAPRVHRGASRRAPDGVHGVREGERGLHLRRMAGRHAPRGDAGARSRDGGLRHGGTHRPRSRGAGGGDGTADPHREHLPHLRARGAVRPHLGGRGARRAHRAQRGDRT